MDIHICVNEITTKVFKKNKLILQGMRNEKIICLLDGHLVHGKKTKKSNNQVKYSDKIKVSEDSN